MDNHEKLPTNIDELMLVGFTWIYQNIISHLHYQPQCSWNTCTVRLMSPNASAKKNVEFSIYKFVF